MGVLAAIVCFTSSVPTPTNLVAALSRHIGEVFSYKAESAELICPILKDVTSLFAADDPQEGAWELRTGYTNGSYLWYACLVVLEKLGGVQQDSNGEDMLLMPAPIWAYRPWQLAKE